MYPKFAPPEELSSVLNLDATPVAVSPTTHVPPPIPAASAFRRGLAGLLDAFFVMGLWCVGLVITSQILSVHQGTIVERLVADFSTPVFVRYAVLEYLALWLAYFALSLGVLDMSFGMWVWGLRVSYGQDGVRPWARKGLRILLSFLFYAPFFPVLLLPLRLRGRNLLDALSTTRLYRTPSQE